MAQKTDFYTLPDEDVLESLRKDVEGIARPAGTSGARSGAGARRAEGSGARRFASSSQGNTKPVIAASLSLFVCGAGQAFNRQVKLGALMFLLAVFAGASHWGMTAAWPELVRVGEILGFGEPQLMMVTASMDLLLLGVILSSVLQAYQRAEFDGGRFEGYNEPVLSGLASLLVPGFGQILNGQIGKAGIFLFCLLAGGLVAALIRFSPLLRIIGVSLPSDLLATALGPVAASVLGIGFMAWILSVYDAVLVASLRRRLT